MRSPLLILALLVGLCGTAQRVSLAYEKTQALLGEPMQVRIETTGAKGVPFGLDTLPHFEVLQQGRIDSNIVGGQLQLAQTITITSWDSGKWELPTSLVDGVPYKPIAITVSYTNPWNPQQPYHDIKGIVPIKNPGRSTWWWYVVGAVVLIALFLLFFPKGQKTDGVVKLDASAYKKAMEALDKLQADNMASVNTKQFHTELVNIFRTYLRGAKGIQSFSKTTDDLSVQLKSLAMPQERYTAMVQTLRLTDLVKFAQYRPDAPANTEALNTIRQSITTIQEARAV